ncbi:MAG TPA: right-handed parallel beta-helix repeat-containing protein, partial [Phycisphaeraceae bacterium]
MKTQQTRFARWHPRTALLVCAWALVGPLHADAFEVNVAVDFGFDPTDATSYFQAALDSGASRVIVPDMGRPWVVRPLNLRSNQEIVFEEGVVVAAKPGAFPGTTDRLFTANHVSNVSLIGYGATLRMNKEEYTTGEGRHILGLFSVNNMTIKGLTFADSGGDGIWLTDAKSPDFPTYNENVLIEDAIFDNNRRQGISVISARNLVIRNVVLRNTNGTAPSAGIDLEPNKANERLEGIVIDGLEVEGNAGSGVLVFLRYLDGTSHPVSIDIRNVNVKSSGQHGITVAGSGDGMLAGQVTIRDSRVANVGGAGVYVYDRSADEFSLHFENIDIRDTNLGYTGTPSHPLDTPAPIMFYLRDVYPYDGVPRSQVGGVTFDNVSVHDVADRPYLAYQNNSNSMPSVVVAGLTGAVTVRNPYGLTPPGVNHSINAVWQWTPFFHHRFTADEGFVTGPATGQQGWYRPDRFTGGMYEIVEGGAGGAPQSAAVGGMIKVTFDTGDARLARALGPDPMDQPLIISADLAFNQISKDLAISVLDITDDDDAFTGVFFGFRRWDGRVYFAYRDGEQYMNLDTLILPDADTFYRFMVTIDPASATYSLIVTDLLGEVLGAVSGVEARQGVTQYQYVTLNVLGASAGDALYVNRLLAAPVPEPGAAAVLVGVGALTLARRCRCSR